MIRSLRFRLTLWYVLVLAVILATFGWALHTIVAMSLKRTLNKTLTLEARSVEDTLLAFWQAEQTPKRGAPGNWLKAPPRSLDEEIERGGFPDLVERWAERTNYLSTNFPIRIFDNHGRHLKQSHHFETLGLIGLDSARYQALYGNTIFETIQTDSGRFQVLTLPVKSKINERLLYIVQVAEPMYQMEVLLAELQLWLLLLLPATVLVVSLIGWTFASRALEPVQRITAHARRMRTAHLSERIDVPKSGDELQRLAQTFNDMLERLERGFAHIRQFSAAASHELRTPLTVMRGELEVTLRKPRSSEEYRLALGTHLQAVDDMTRVVENLLALARSESLDSTLEWKALELVSFMEHTSHIWRKWAQTRGIQITFEGAGPVWVRGEPQLLERLVANLLDNAVRHTPENGHITICVATQEKQGIIVVENTGAGIDPEVLPRLFHPLKPNPDQSETTSRGLGLSLCRWIVEAHQGHIDVSSKPSEGATFTVWLPLTKNLPQQEFFPAKAR